MKSFLIIILFTANLFAQTYKTPLVHTYSIVARDTETGEMGVAVQSHWFSVGSIVTWGEAGVGVIATQSFVNPAFGPEGLKLLKSGYSAQQAVDKMIAEDEARDMRQLAIIDSKGRSAAYTGKNCIPGAGHIVGENYSVQANLMLNDKVWTAMSESFTKSKGSLAERLVAALEAAENAGGDIRGKQSAAILVVKGTPSGKVWDDRKVDLRVEYHPETIQELKRLLQVHKAYEHMNNGDLAVEKGDMKKAMEEYSSAEKLFPDNEEMLYWHAVALANNAMMDEALPIFEKVFRKNDNWKTLTPRLRKVGQLNISEEQFLKIMEQ